MVDVIVVSSPHQCQMWCLTSRESLEVLAADNVGR